MSTRIRFTSARDVVDAFKELRQIRLPPGVGDEPLAYARALLASRRPIDSILFLSYLLPRREAVWWGLQCVRAILGGSAEDEALRLADAWVRGPEEGLRRSALEAGLAGETDSATNWLALAAGRSGGSVSPIDQPPMTADPAACAQAVGAAVVLAICSQEPKTIGAWTRACAEAGIRFAEGGDARVTLARAGL